jgi:NADPH:quinone reductase-like Zn-dependent oxidoreductase
VIAVASASGKVDPLLKAGATATIDARAPDWADQVLAITGGRGVDVLLESSGGDTLAQGCLRSRLSDAPLSTGPPAAMTPDSMRPRCARCCTRQRSTRA